MQRHILCQEQGKTREKLVPAERKTDSCITHPKAARAAAALELFQ